MVRRKQKIVVQRATENTGVCHPMSLSSPQEWVHLFGEGIFGMALDRQWNEQIQKTLIFSGLLCVSLRPSVSSV
jgi:hypothetical protein